MEQDIRPEIMWQIGERQEKSATLQKLFDLKMGICKQCKHKKDNT